MNFNRSNEGTITWTQLEKAPENIDFRTLSCSHIIESILSKSKEKLTENSINIIDFPNKISKQLLNSLNIIKETTDTLLIASPQFENPVGTVGLTNYLENLMLEITNLENLICNNSEETISPRSYYPLLPQTELETLVFMDPVTQLPNRRFFEAYIKELITMDEERFYVFFIDIDDFKAINDTYGHGCGDILLKCIGARIQHNLRDNDIVARYGGDEFIAIVHHKRDLDIEKILKRIVDVNQTPYNINGNHFTLTISIGVSIYPDHAQTIEDLLCCADRAMYFSKNAGKNAFTMAEKE